MKTICIFCGSSMGSDPIYREKAEELADYLIAHDLTLVYGGADVGLMKILADRMLAHNKTVIGVNFAVTRDFDGTNFGIPIEFARRLVDEAGPPKGD